MPRSSSASLASAADYERHRPEETPPYGIVETYYPQFLARLEAEGGSLPEFVKQEFDDYLKCAPRARVSARQVRCLQPRTPGRLGVVCRGISTYFIKQAGFTVASGAKTGAVTLIQRFGSALNLNIHFHMRFLDGVYSFDRARPKFLSTDERGQVSRH